MKRKMSREDRRQRIEPPLPDKKDDLGRATGDNLGILSRRCLGSPKTEPREISCSQGGLTSKPHTLSMPWATPRNSTQVIPSAGSGRRHRTPSSEPSRIKEVKSSSSLDRTVPGAENRWYQNRSYLPRFDQAHGQQRVHRFFQ